MNEPFSSLRTQAALCGQLLLIVLLAGCGSGVYPVEGNVVWQDGSPATELAGSFVSFEEPELQISARGTVQPDATFRLTTHKSDDGAPPGKYTVLIVEVGLKPLGGPDSSAIAPGAMQAKFSDPTTSGLTAEVLPQTNRVTLTVERAR